MVFLSHRNLRNRLLETHGSLFRAVTMPQPSAARNFPGGNTQDFLADGPRSALRKNLRTRFFKKHARRRISGNAASREARLIVTDSSLGLAEVSAMIASPAGTRVLAGIDKQNEDVLEATNRRVD